MQELFTDSEQKMIAAGAPNVVESSIGGELHDQQRTGGKGRQRDAAPLYVLTSDLRPAP